MLNQKAPYIFSKCIPIALIAFASTGCSTSLFLEEIQHPRDTAIIIGPHYYLISPYKCAKAKSIDEKGIIECYAADDSKSASVPPIGNFQRRMFEKHLPYAWASNEHQAALYHFHYQGGKEQAAANVVSALTAAHTAVEALDSVSYAAHKSAHPTHSFGNFQELDSMSVWEAKEFSIANWHLQNSTIYNLGDNYDFSSQGFESRRLGNLSLHKGGSASYHTGNTTYHTGGMLTHQVTDSISRSSNGKHCIKISIVTRCR